MLSCPILYSKLLYKLGQDFLDILGVWSNSIFVYIEININCFSPKITFSLKRFFKLPFNLSKKGKTFLRERERDYNCYCGKYIYPCLAVVLWIVLTLSMTDGFVLPLTRFDTRVLCRLFVRIGQSRLLIGQSRLLIGQSRLLIGRWRLGDKTDTLTL